MAIQRKKAKQRQRMGQTTAQPQSGRTGRVAFALLVAAAVLALVFFLVLRTQNQTSIAENALGTILSPIQKAFSGVTIFVRDTINGVKDYVNMSNELAQIKLEVDDLKLQVVENQEAVYENERLKALLGMKERYASMDPIPARVISKNPGIWYDVFSIDAGTNQGLKANMAVVTGDGLVGYLYEVGATYSKVRTVIDEQSSVACLIERTRDDGIMSGRTDINSDVVECRIRYLPSINDVSHGDVVLTSGMDNFYPKGIKIGEVTQVSRQSVDSTGSPVIMQPSVDFLRIEEVLVFRAVVERMDEKLVPVLTPTPRPSASVVPTPTPSPTPSTISSGLEEVFRYPDGVMTEDGEYIELETKRPSAQGQPQSQNNMIVEEEWAR